MVTRTTDSEDKSHTKVMATEASDRRAEGRWLEKRKYVRLVHAVLIPSPLAQLLPSACVGFSKSPLLAIICRSQRI